MNDYELPGRPQKQIANLSVAMGKILSGILFSSVCPTAAAAPIITNGNEEDQLTTSRNIPGAF